MVDPRQFTFITQPPLLHVNAALHNLATLGATTTATTTTVSSTTARTTIMDSISEDDNSDDIDIKATDTTDKTNSTKANDTVTVVTASTSNSCDDVVACAQLAQLGHALVRLPVEPLIGKMLIIGVLLGIAEHAQLIAAILTIQSPFESARSGSSSSGIKRFHNVHGDAFSCADAYRAWIHVKADRKVSSRRWCKSHGIKEQRLYEISKLVTQYGDLLRDLKYSAGLIVPAFAYHTKPNRVSKAQIRQLRADQDVTLHMLDSNELSGSNSGGGSSNTQHNTDAAQLQDKHDLLNEQSIHMAKTSSNSGGSSNGKRSRIDVNSIEFYAQHSTDALSTVATSAPTHYEIALLKAIICAGNTSTILRSSSIHAARISCCYSISSCMYVYV
jgi:Helicase associated domain (HA2)